MKIHVVGWAGINHSYSIVAEAYISGLMKNKENEMYFTSYPLYDTSWKKVRTSIFDHMNEPKEYVDVTIRFAYPYNLVPDENATATVVFMTSEFNYISDVIDTQNICRNVWIITPSEYSKRGIINSGINAEQIIVVPHCYDYDDIKETKDELRQKYNIPKNHFVYFHNSSLTSNKNVNLIIESFQILYETTHDITLLIKGVDRTYNSYNKLVEIVQILSNKMSLTCTCNIKYIGKDMSANEISELYELSDCYVSPFMAEGFNLPILEAMCHGKNVICTKGGASDEFAKDSFFIDSKWKVDEIKKININGNEMNKEFLYPEPQSLMKLMSYVMFFQKQINRDYYRETYSSKKIGMQLQQNLLKIVNNTKPLPQIVILDDELLEKTISNIHIFAPKVFINVLTFDKNKDNMIDNIDKLRYIYIKQHHKLYNRILHVMQVNKIKEMIFVNNTLLLFADPRTILNADNSVILMANNMIMLAYIKQGYIVEEMNKMLVNFDEHTLMEHKWITMNNMIRLLYIKRNGKYEKVVVAYDSIHNNAISVEKTLIEPTDNKLTISKLLHKSDQAVILMDTVEKYKEYLHSAKLTVIYDTKNLVTLSNDDMLRLNQAQTLFVYPETIPFFFDKIYPLLMNKFELHTLKNEYDIVKYDTRKLINEIISI